MPLILSGHLALVLAKEQSVAHCVEAFREGGGIQGENKWLRGEGASSSALRGGREDGTKLKTGKIEGEALKHKDTHYSAICAPNMLRKCLFVVC